MGIIIVLFFDDRAEGRKRKRQRIILLFDVRKVRAREIYQLTVDKYLRTFFDRDSKQRILETYKFSKNFPLNRNQERLQRSPGNRRIFNRESFPSGSNRHLVHPTHRRCEFCYFNSLHLAFILLPLNHEWFDIQHQPITAQDTRWLPLSTTF